MWSLSVVLLGCIVMGADSYVDELTEKISAASECIGRLVDCSRMYKPVAENEINGSLFYEIKDLEKACQLNEPYLKCVDKTKVFCRQGSMTELEASMIRNRLWLRDLCEPNSVWKNEYKKSSFCIIKESYRYGRACSRQLKPVDPRLVGLDDLCRFFKGIVDCLGEVFMRECGEKAAELFVRVSFMQGNREYLCQEKRRKESSGLLAAKQMLRNVRGLMANISNVVKATMSKEDASYILQDMDPQEIERIKELFRSKDGIKYGESPLFEMQDLIDDDEDEFPSRDNVPEYEYQIIELHTAKKSKDKAEMKKVDLEDEYAVDWSSRFNDIYKSDEIDIPEESYHPFQKADLEYPEGSEHTIQKDDVQNPEDQIEWSEDLFRLSHQAVETYDHTESVEADYNEPQFHLVHNDVEYSDIDLSKQLHTVDKSEEIEARSEPKYDESGKYPLCEDDMDGNTLTSMFPEDSESVKNCELEGFCSSDDVAELHSKDSIQKRALELLQEENEAIDAFDRNFSLVFPEYYELPEHIKDVEDELLNQKNSKPLRKYQTSHCQISEAVREDSSAQTIVTDDASSFAESNCSPETGHPDTPTDCKTDIIPNIVGWTDCKNGNIQNIVSTTIKPGIYVEVTSLQTINTLKFGRGCQFAESVNYIVVGEPYHPTESPLGVSDSTDFEPEAKPISVGLLDAEHFINNGIDSIVAEQVESKQE